MLHLLAMPETSAVFPVSRFAMNLQGNARLSRNLHRWDEKAGLPAG
jgi:hypothetical protein